MKLVKFLRGHGVFNAGEVAGVLDDVAQVLVERGAAEFVEAPKPALKAVEAPVVDKQINPAKKDSAQPVRK